MIYTGLFICPVDKLGRIILPRGFRRESMARSATLYVRANENYLILTVEQSLRDHLTSIASGDDDDAEIREIRRLAMAPVKTVHVDPQGRLKIPDFPNFKGGDTMILVGAGHDFEIWTQPDWKDRYPEMEPEP
ncbi:hypothetical protein JXA40_07290 [bacterium]|nr:hypothetical protein [candidate division CSSED10-310 bacterium]